MPENNLFDIKKRVKAAKQTRKITGTMELIASSRLYRGKLLLANYQDWAKHMHEAVRCLPDSYFEPPADCDGESKRAYIIFGGSKGLSGSYGPNLLQYAAEAVGDHYVIAVGTATEDFFPAAHSCFVDETPSADGARAIAHTAMALCESKRVNAVYLIYMRGTEPVSERMFPLVRRKEYRDMVILAPAEKLLFPELVGEYLETLVYEAYLHSFVAEQIARVSAMDSATQNADGIIEELQYKYNRMRQTAITQEIMMVSNAAKGGGA